MSATHRLAALVVTGVLLLAATGGAIASPAQYDRPFESNSTDDDRPDTAPDRMPERPGDAIPGELPYPENAFAHDGHLSLSMHTDDENIVVEVEYEGNGSATLRVEGVNGTYEGSGVHHVTDEKRLVLPAPQEPKTVRVTVESDRYTVRRTLTFDYRTVGCADEHRLLTIVRQKHSGEVRIGNETRSWSRHLSPEWPEVDCAEAIPHWNDPDDDNRSDERGDRFDEQRRGDVPERFRDMMRDGNESGQPDQYREFETRNEDGGRNSHDEDDADGDAGDSPGQSE